MARCQSKHLVALYLAAAFCCLPLILATEQPFMCLILRTNNGHGRLRGGPVYRLLQHLRTNNYTRWQAFVIVKDTEPFAELTSYLEEINDPRFKIYAEEIGPEHSPASPKYHDELYGTTDEAIRACPSDTHWLLVTDGNTDYDTNFFPTLLAMPEDADIVAFDFYSALKRPTAERCARFARAPKAAPCKRNMLAPCQTAHSANVMLWKKFVDEDRRFKGMSVIGVGQDGFLAEELLLGGWVAYHVSNKCYVDYNHSPIKCAMSGGVWDDFEPTSWKTKCLDPGHAHAMMMSGLPVEKVDIQLANDGTSFGMLERKGKLKLSCIRHKEWDVQNYFTPEHCADKIDKPFFPRGRPIPWQAKDEL